MPSPDIKVCTIHTCTCCCCCRLYTYISLYFPLPFLLCVISALVLMSITIKDGMHKNNLYMRKVLGFELRKKNNNKNLHKYMLYIQIKTKK